MCTTETGGSWGTGERGAETDPAAEPGQPEPLEKAEAEWKLRGCAEAGQGRGSDGILGRRSSICKGTDGSDSRVW